ncbi:MAG: hypothetical protein C5B54_05505, partial [Acidobacteria bacterium]
MTLEEFGRNFFDPDRRLTSIGGGSIGGKAQGLVDASEILTAKFPAEKFLDLPVNIPAFTVIRTDVFDEFLQRNELEKIAYSDAPDDVIALEFQRASLPAEILGDLRALIQKVHQPLAIRSSSLLEDSLQQPFAGVYMTKMIPNNQPSADERFRKLSEAIKLVYASAFSRSAKDYLRAIQKDPREEKMAVLIQEVVGSRFGDRFYPEISGVARSYHFYATGRARPEHGVVSLALGLGKTIVDGGKCWTYSPAFPTLMPPSTTAELLDQTQVHFWAVNMGKPPAYDPIQETEYLLHLMHTDAEADGALNLLASTYDPQSDRLSMGTTKAGPRILDFSGILRLKEIPLNDVVKVLLQICAEHLLEPVEIEFAVTLHPRRLGLLQVRPMAVPGETVEINERELTGSDLLLASENVLGNGRVNDIHDILFVRPDRFNAKHSKQIAFEIEAMNRHLLEEKKPYILIGFGRWGSSDPWLGIPVTWGQVSGAKSIVEATLENMNIDLSQGSHFFHNLLSFQVTYFCVPHSGKYEINWKWL